MPDLLTLMSTPEAWLSFGVLALMEIVLGIDNIVFITILCGRLPKSKELLGRRVGIAMALISRLALLATINWVVHLKDELFFLVRAWSGKDLILVSGGLFLLYKATREIYENVEHAESVHTPGAAAAAEVTLASVIVQVMILDVVFSLDSVITAVGMAEDIRIMVAAVLVSVAVMLLFAGPVGDFVEQNPSVKVLALSFLVLIGATLLMEGTGVHVSKGYLYSAMGFSLFVQLLNMRMDRRRRSG